MSAILIAVLALTAISISLYPLFQMDRQRVRAAATVDLNLENLLSAREATYSAIKDLETDHAMGKLSDDDYRNLRAKYEGKALTLLQRLDALQPALPAKPVVVTSGACPRCGTAHGAGAKFCRRCGATLGAACPSCGTDLSVGSKFCRKCGSPVPTREPA